MRFPLFHCLRVFPFFEQSYLYNIQGACERTRVTEGLGSEFEDATRPMELGPAQPLSYIVSPICKLWKESSWFTELQNKSEIQ